MPTMPTIPAIPTVPTIPNEALAELARAKLILENPSLTSRAVDFVGRPIEKGMKFLPHGLRTLIHKITHKALYRSLAVAAGTMRTAPRAPSRRLHRGLAAASGAVGGAFGLPALVLELPISTTIMLRSIADIARSHGEDLSQLESRIACMQVFAFGGASPSDDATETGYYNVRMVLAGAVSEAATFIARKGLVEEGAPAIVRLITQIATRFSIPVSEKIAAQSIPVIGAVSGAFINVAFTQHFQSLSEAHFTVRRLERQHGQKEIQSAYHQLPTTPKQPKQLPPPPAQLDPPQCQS